MKKIVKGIKLFVKYLVRFAKKYPDTVNFNITYRCNSHCVMCNMWKQSPGMEFSIEDLSQTIKGDLFKKVKHVGITGGEPSLRDDFDDIVGALIEGLPSLSSLSIITNCVDADRSIYISKCLHDRCMKNGLQYGIVLSMDGVGFVHDRNRRVRGNFDSLMLVASELRKMNISFSLGSTITNKNISGIYETLEFSQNNGYDIYFAIAEFIDRLYNSDCDSIKNFTNDELYELLLFFHRLSNDSNQPKYYRRSYWKDFELLLGNKRPIGCPYHNQGVVLGPELQVGHCAVHGSIVGDARKNNISDVFFRTWRKDKKNVRKYCDNCYHYHYEMSIGEFMDGERRKIIHRIMKVDNLFLNKAISVFLRPPKQKNYVLVVGWYGTETVGDKAILGSIIRDYQGQGYNVVVASLYPFITHRTIGELNFEAKVVAASSLDLLRYARYAEKVIMGGGPLMDLEDLKYPYISFNVAKTFGKETIIYGCGIGPLKKKKNVDVVRDMMKMSSQISLRDSQSVKQCLSWIPDKQVENSGDPAVSFVRDRAFAITKDRSINKKMVLACFLRELPKEYALSCDKFDENKKIFEDKLADFLKNYAINNSIEEVVFYSMHNFWIGDDDRVFSRYFVNNYFAGQQLPFSVRSDDSLSTVDNTIIRMLEAEKVVCMRFHSVLFASTMKLDYFAIDYTNGGKIWAYLNDNHELHRLVKF